MALWVCRRCGCKFAVGLSMCPQCTGTDVEADDMPKVTGSGPSNAAEDLPQAVDEPVEEESSADGTDGSKSSESEQTPPSEETTSKRKSARTTESRSAKAHPGKSTARSTGTDRKPSED